MDNSKLAVVGGFDARQMAERAADQLLKWGFAEDSVVVAVRDHDYSASGGLMVRSEEEDAITHLAHIIALTGVREETARSLAVQFDSADAIVGVDVDGRYDEASAILRDYGGKLEWESGAGRAEWEQARDVLRGHWERRDGEEIHPWSQAESGYHYVYEKAIEPEFRGRTWQSAEPKLESGFEGWATERGYQTPGNAWDWLKETLHEIWTPATRGAAPDDIVHPERLHRWVRLVKTRPAPNEPR